MAAIDFGRMKRLLVRCGELANNERTKPIVRTVYRDRLEAVATEFLAAHDAIPGVESAYRKESQEASARLDAFDQPYREARAVYLAYYPEAVLPMTLKDQPTDTDRKSAVLALLDRIDDHIDAGWAEALVAGPFGENASAIIAEIDEASAANAALSAARERRARAYGPAYEAYLAFKNVVRQALGPSSREYRRIHLRADGSLGDEPAVALAEGSATAAEVGAELSAS
jgi:hypothetical protein